MPDLTAITLLNLFNAKRYSSCVNELESLAEYGSVEAAKAVACIYFHGGDGIPKDVGRAKRWLDASEGRDSTGRSSYMLGVMFYKGLGVEVDHDSAYRWFRRGAIKRHARSLLMVAAFQSERAGFIGKRQAAKVIYWHAVRDRRLDVMTRALTFYRWLVL
ncbi:tetratricopeptide repeat protein [Lysobacter sp. 2RAF19]